MPLPRHATTVPHVQLAAASPPGGVTELRVHGVGGTPPDALLGDVSPELACGDTTAGFYRSSDHGATEQDRAQGRDTGRHVEAYSWGGLTSLSKVRVLWLVLLPFLLGNLAGWMCSRRTRESGWKFRLHRLSCGLGALALTVNASLLTVLITANVLAYQVPRAGRAGRAGRQWWLAPLGWHLISGHPARQVLIGIAVPALLLGVLWWLARRSWRYEAVKPLYRKQPAGPSRMYTAAALKDGLASSEFWDGENSVRLMTRVHIGAVMAFLAIVLAISAKALTAGPSHAAGWWWAAVLGGAAAAALAVLYLCADALAGENDVLRNAPLVLLGVAGAALVCAGVFAWLQPGGPATSAQLPGLAGIIGWTALAIVVPLVLVLLSALLGLDGRARGTLACAPWVTLMLAFALLNCVLLCAAIWVAHVVAPVTTSAAQALTQAGGQIYLPYVITSGAPLVAWAAVLTALVFGVVELARWWGRRQLTAGGTEYEKGAAEVPRTQPADLQAWYWSGLPPYAPAGQDASGEDAHRGWQQTVARAQFLGSASHDAGYLLWGIIVVQLAAALCSWQLHWQPPVVVRNAGVVIAGLVLPTAMAFVYAAWGDPVKRRTLGVLWDIGTFWPRSYHPLSPPCYSERAVPDLQRRMWWLHANQGRVVLAAHSQGAMLATAALVQTGCRPAGDSPVLVTFGSPVRKLYGWGFPAYITADLLAPLAPGGAAGVSLWRNFFYPTDPIGGPVADELPVAEQRRVDQFLVDPAQCWYIHGQDPSSPQGHSGYWADARVWDEIDQAAATLSVVPEPQEVSRFFLRPGRERHRRREVRTAATTASGAEAVPGGTSP